MKFKIFVSIILLLQLWAIFVLNGIINPLNIFTRDKLLEIENRLIKLESICLK